MTVATVCNCAASGFPAGNCVCKVTPLIRPVRVLAYLLPRVITPLAACTSCTPLSNVSSCCAAEPVVEEVKLTLNVDIPVGGTVAGKVCTPVQNNWQPVV